MGKKQLTKKQTIIILILVFVATPSFLFLTNHKKYPEPDFKNDYERTQYIEDFVKKEEGEDPNNNIISNEGGYSGILIENKQSLLKFMNIDEMIKCNDMLNEAFKHITKLYEDNKEEIDINEFYNKNIDVITHFFGITNIDKFKIFLNDIIFIGDNGKIVEAIILDNSVLINNEVIFNLTLKSTNGNSNTFKIKFLIQEDNKNEKIIYWY